MEEEACTQVMNVVPYLRLIGGVIGWSFTTFLLLMFGKYVVNGVSHGTGMYLLDHTQGEERERIISKFGNGTLILRQLRKIEERFETERANMQAERR